MIVQVKINGKQYPISNNWVYHESLEHIIKRGKRVVLAKVSTIKEPDKLTDLYVLVPVCEYTYLKVITDDSGFNCIGDNLLANVPATIVEGSNQIEYLNFETIQAFDLLLEWRNSKELTNHLLKKLKVNIQNDRKLPLSQYWDHVLTLDDLLKDVSWVFMDFTFKRHKTDNCYSGIAMYVRYKDSDISNIDKSEWVKLNYTEIGISEDGFTYNGDVSFSIAHFDRLERVPTKDAIDILLKWGELNQKREDLAVKMVKYTDRNHINLFLANNYSEERKHNG